MNPGDLPSRLKRAGRSQAELARHLRLDPSSLTKTIKGQRVLKADEMMAIEAFFESAPSDPNAPIDLASRRRSGQRRIPVYGYAAAGGDDRIAYADGRVIEWIDPPPLWSGAGDLIAVRVVGVSMEPRLFEGEMVVAQLALPPARNRDCLIEMQDGSALVKTYATQKDGFVFCHQWNPDKEVRLKTDDVKALHAIIWRR